jgi:hypothetical protein
MKAIRIITILFFVAAFIWTSGCLATQSKSFARQAFELQMILSAMHSGLEV